MANIDNNTTNLENILSDIDNIADPVSGTLSITVNGTYDVSTYASANVNVQSAPVLLWTNASIGVSEYQFSPQTLTFSGSWDAYMVEFAHSSTSFMTTNYWDVRKIVFVYHQAFILACGNFASVRTITSFTGNSITFSNGYKSSGSSSNERYAIPTRIWGVKWTL